MTNDDKALVERLRDNLWGHSVTDTLSNWVNERQQAADRIEALSAENERLNEESAILRSAMQLIADGFRLGLADNKQPVRIVLDAEALSKSAKLALAALGEQ